MDVAKEQHARWYLRNAERKVVRIAKATLRFVFATFLVYVGVKHFTDKDFFLKIMPPYIPFHLACVYVSGAIEIILGFLLGIPQTSRFAGWGLILLFVAIFPANIHVYMHQELIPASPLAHLLRLPLQGVLIAWAYWYTRPDRTTVEVSSERAGVKTN